MNRIPPADAPAPSPAEPPGASSWLIWLLRLAGRASGNATLIVVGTVLLTNIIRLASSLVLTRLLDAQAFGIVAIVTSISFIVTMVADAGIFQFVVRHADGEDPRFLDQVWTLRLLRSLVLAAAMVALAWPVAQYTGRVELGPVVALWSLTFLLDGMSSMAFATAVRDQKLRRLSIFELSMIVLQTLITIALTLVMRSYWALVAAIMISLCIKTTLSYVLFAQSRRRFALSRERAGEMWAFSRFIAGSSFLTVILSQADKLVLARFLPLSTFGLYSIATQLAAVPTGLAYSYCDRVLFPMFARTAREHPDRLGAVFYGRWRLVAATYMLAIGVLIGAAPVVVEILYDPRYRAVGAILQILAAAPLMLLMNFATNQLLVAMGHPIATLHINQVRIGWLALVGGLGLLVSGPIALVVAVGTIEIPVTAYCWLRLRRARLWRPGRELIGLACGAAGILLGLGATHWATRAALIPTPPSLSDLR